MLNSLWWGKMGRGERFKEIRSSQKHVSFAKIPRSLPKLWLDRLTRDTRSDVSHTTITTNQNRIDYQRNSWVVVVPHMIAEMELVRMHKSLGTTFSVLLVHPFPFSSLVYFPTVKSCSIYSHAFLVFFTCYQGCNLLVSFFIRLTLLQLARVSRACFMGAVKVAKVPEYAWKWSIFQRAPYRTARKAA